ncbi:acid phosphatase type 7-like isoform X2 [Ostrea edulis]|uniref:acid phosphatase type 7-like isoform X2 n=1 Tax=Ostrea edulis TaxID=37623 RepID=UPI0024AE9157|nr:acid phosphatase type 7-like isoform X2 [Ostrea edulis]
MSSVVLLWMLYVWGGSGVQSLFHEDEARCHPEEVHIAFGNKVSDVVVIWSTVGNCSTSVEYGPGPWNLSLTTSGETKLFIETNPSGKHYLHRVVVKDLDNSLTYFYRPISNGISSGPFYFKTPPSGNDWHPEFLVYGDLGIESHAVPALEKEALSGRYTAIFHVGDFAYNMEDDGGKRGDTFLRLIEDFSARVQYMTAPGNHEMDGGSFSHYRYRFSTPGTEWPIPMNKMWYSIDVGLVHFISYSTEVFFIADGQHIAQQQNWLMADLKQANDNRKRRPWVIALGHRPMYCSNSDADDCTKPTSKVRAGLEDIFYKYGVDIVLQAHEHSYERLWPQYKGVVLSKNYTNPQAPVQLISGAAGSKYKRDPEKAQRGEWSAFANTNESLNSIGKLKILNESHLYWEQYNLLTKQVIDSIMVVQESHGPFKQQKLSHEVTQKIENIKEKEKEQIKHNEVNPSPPDHSPGNTPGRNKSIGTGQKIKEMLSHVDKRTVIGVCSGAGALILLIVIIVVVKKKKAAKSRKYRRWDDKVDYGRKFYSSYNHVESGEKEADDFEVDVSDGNLPTAKLLTDDRK